ncbi:MAG: GNAT family N-acetyltransferase [Acidimicrobiales bacterium]
MSDATYPSELETVAVLRDGVPVLLRPIRPDDAEQLGVFHSKQSPESIYFRFFRHRPELSDSELEYFTNIDYDRRMAFVAVQGDEIVAVSRYEAYKDRNEAEVAFFVDDANHGRGLATLMLEYLAAHGRRRRFDNFTATVLPENYRMLNVFRRAGFEVKTKFDEGVIDVRLGIDVTPETSAVISARDRQARAASVARILKPASLAVVGVGRRESSIGRQLLKRIVSAGFVGTAYAVRPVDAGDDWRSVEGSLSMSSLAEIEGMVDLVIVAVAADAVEGVVQAAVEAKAGSLLIVSSGFADAGPAGREARDAGGPTGPLEWPPGYRTQRVWCRQHG